MTRQRSILGRLLSDLAFGSLAAPDQYPFGGVAHDSGRLGAGYCIALLRDLGWQTILATP